ncbi:MAG: DNA-3-methyladenine glycosylase I [Parcubacteria group bacterium GW2011_GWF2_44_8b]|nr:MAG: DNA-3-methyladenine glycosylase I [Parcubacteria group bacterium GW2011_GWC1_43_30]KKT79912.1 MAG: DNA-3-methyladenine glycosylase I [Parcubacteria group bacterium GW2011_GWF2_44_8b]
MKKVCSWPKGEPLMVKYHDKEWGKPVRRDRKIFEFLVLESAQAGLSWLTILRKREGYRHAFADFEPSSVARFSAQDISRLTKNRNIIRNRLKIEAAINNAKRFLEVQKEFGTFSKYMWSFVKGRPIDGKRQSLKDLPATSKESETFTKDLKRRGFKFLGPIVIYAHMQAVGMVNDHVLSCFRHKELKTVKSCFMSTRE